MKSDTTRRLLLGVALGASLAPFSVLAQTPLSGRYGIVEIGSSGVKATAISFDREAVLEPSEPGSPGSDGLSRAERYRTNTLGSFTDDPIVRDAGQISETVRAVESAIRQLRTSSETNVPRDNIYVVASSSVAVLPHRPQLEEALMRRNIATTFISASDEAELTFRWVVLPTRWTQAVLVDVGSGNTKGGYINNTGAFTTFRAFDVPYGSRSLAERATALAASQTPDAWEQALTSAGREQVDPLLRAAASNNPGLVSRPRLYIAGGAAWALASFMHPQDSITEPNWVRLNRNDITTFRQQVFENADAAVQNRLARISDPNIRQQAETLIANVRERIAPQQMRAGAEILAIMARHFNVPGKQAIFFSKEALYAWPTMHLLRTLGAER